MIGRGGLVIFISLVGLINFEMLWGFVILRDIVLIGFDGVRNFVCLFSLL